MTQSLITEQKTWTDQAFMALNRDEHHYELVNREVVDVGNSGMEHSHLACLLVIQLGAYIQTHKLGYQLKAEECGAPRRTLPLNFFAFSGKP